MHVRVVPALLSADRIDAKYHAPQAVAIRSQIARLGLRSQPLGELFAELACGPFGSTLTADQHSIQGEILLVQPTNISEFLFDDSKCWRISRSVLKSAGLCTYPPGTLLFARVGIYPHVGVLPDGVGEATISSSMIAGVPGGVIDHHYLLALLRSLHGQVLLTAAQKITAQPTIGTYEIASTRVPVPTVEAQRYIGDKVRQAERLRQLAQSQRRSLAALLAVERVLEAMATPDSRTSRISMADLKSRLDAKYYGARSMAVLRAAAKNSRPLGSLVDDISNGFEHREFVDDGTRYVRAGDVSSGRLILRGASMIARDVSVPQKARIDAQCTLLVRSGAGIVVAAKAFDEDAGASMGSDLIRLRCPSKPLAAVIAAYMNSEVGVLLQSRISYGAAQPHIGQDELLELPLPCELLDHADAILYALETEDEALRAAERLVLAAKLLVEALIDGRISEPELITAQQAIERGDTSPDLQILRRLTPSGMDREGERPLIPDVEALLRLVQDVTTETAGAR